jgi:hypothetical protein
LFLKPWLFHFSCQIASVTSICLECL